MSVKTNTEERSGRTRAYAEKQGAAQQFRIRDLADGAVVSGITVSLEAKLVRRPEAQRGKQYAARDAAARGAAAHNCKAVQAARFNLM